MSETFTIRPMTRAEFDFGIELAAREGWNPGLHDADPFYATDPGGFLIGLLEDRPIGCISAVSYHGIFGFMGFYIVLPEYRDHGYGMQLYEKGRALLAGQNVGGDGVLERLDDYSRVGFRLAYKNHRFEYVPEGTKPEPRPEIVPISAVPFEMVLLYDSECFPAERRRFLTKWLTMPESTGLGFFDAGRLQGYGVIRKCHRGYKIGPLFADNPEIAESLFLTLCAGAEPGEPVYLDVPEVNGPGMELASSYDMKEVFATGRIYTERAPDIRLDKVFGVTSFELG